MCYDSFFPLSDMCDTSWRLSRDRLIIAGFVVSILVLILDIILILVLYYLGKQVRDYMQFEVSWMYVLWAILFFFCETLQKPQCIVTFLITVN